MRISLLVFLTFISVSASAQWISFKKHERFPLLTQVTDHSVNRIPGRSLSVTALRKTFVPRSDYSLELAENVTMKTAQHNMRFRVYNVASYNFNQLAQLYVQQHRFSEAKWFFLQSNIISREQNNDKLTIANLVHLAGVKSAIGDFTLAQQDLFEARGMAANHGWLIDMVFIEQKLSDIQYNRINSAPIETRYASNVTAAGKTVVE